MNIEQQLQHFQEAIEYSFDNSELLHQALTHRSVRNALHNERLEFLGDIVLGHIISLALFTHYSDSSEGELSRMRSRLICGDQLAVLAQSIPLGPYLFLGNSEKNIQGEKKTSILAGAFEAVIGAIYLDANWTICQKWVLAFYQELLYSEALPNYKDSKSALQEYAQARGYSLPCYTVSITGTAHLPEFHVESFIPELPYKAKSSAANRRLAEKKAAAAYLTLLDSKKESSNV